MNEAWIEIHALDDIEFYSRLLDEITDFKSWFKEYKAWHTNVISMRTSGITLNTQSFLLV